MSDPTTNKALVTEFIDALFTRGDLNAVDRYLAPGFVNHDPFPASPPTWRGSAGSGRSSGRASPTGTASWRP